MNRRELSLSAALKQAIADSGLPLLRIERDTGVARATVMRFMRGDADLRLATADRLASYFGLTVIRDKGR